MANFKKVNPKQSFPDLEKKILNFWEKEKIFEKSLEKTKNGDKFIFYEGPPTANGKPGIHHVLARAFKDIICRYKTMKGFYVGRRAGWDTHGLPVEIQVEKELGISGKPEIEKYGVEKFNQKCKMSVWQYKKCWEDLTKKMGFWIDLDNSYITYENEYIEKVWGILKQIWNKGLIYKGYKSIPWCPRCGTALSSHEVAQGYKTIEDESVYVKFKIQNAKNKNTYFLVWTTTPWTLPGNAALAVGEDIEYVEIEKEGEYLILAKDLAQKVIGQDIKIVKELKGSELVDEIYEPLFDNSRFLKHQGKADFQVWGADFVTTDEGTGIVHIAPAFGEDDLNLQKEKNFSVPVTVASDGSMLYDIGKGKFVSAKGGSAFGGKDADFDIKSDLKNRGLLFKEERIKHEYPFCWRCDSPLIYFARSSWFIEMSKLRDKLMENNEKINWIPEYIKKGRFGEWLEEVKDWALSRERYWGTPLPIWECQCGEKIMIGSIKELEKSAIKKYNLEDLHKPNIDEVQIKCPKCSKNVKRVKEVIDCWFDAGSMPFASGEYPANYPADYITEAIDQTRGWFYTMLAISTLLDKGSSYKNAICLGLVLDEQGKKMSKSRGNIIDPFEMMEKISADAIRWLFYTMNGPGDSKRVGEKSINQSLRKFILLLWNVYSFFVMYSNIDGWKYKGGHWKPSQILDKWIVSSFYRLIQEVEEKLDEFDVVSAARKIEQFNNDLSTWYLRRSRKRRDNDFYATMFKILIHFSKVVAPFTPFVAEEIYQNLRSDDDDYPESVHLCDWPEIKTDQIDQKLIEQMNIVKKIVEIGHSIRASKGIKLRQPLLAASSNQKIDEDFVDIIKEELNVKEYRESLRGEEKTSGDIKVILDINITNDLREEGFVRDFIREIQQARKEANLTPSDKIQLYYQVSGDIEMAIEKFSKNIKKGTNSIQLFQEKGKTQFYKEIKIGDENIWIGIKKENEV
jgi:isoleucyl-tRNA synthetase